MSKILIVEDDTTIRTTLQDAFRGEGYETDTAADGKEAGEKIYSRHFDAIILDVMMPHRSGFEILKEMREQGIGTPVLLLTVRNDENDKVLGLELGAEDYVTKPFSLRELLARVKVQLRRQKELFREITPKVPGQFEVGGARVDLESFQVLRGKEKHSLSSREAKMLAVLKVKQGMVVSRDQFLDEVWGEDSSVGHRTIDTHILNLRNKIEKDPKQPRHLLTAHGVGYRLQP